MRPLFTLIVVVVVLLVFVPSCVQQMKQIPQKVGEVAAEVVEEAFYAITNFFVQGARRIWWDVKNWVAGHTSEIAQATGKLKEKFWDKVCEKAEITGLCEGAKKAKENLDRTDVELDMAQEMCPKLPAVVQAFPDASAYAFCNSNNRIFKNAKARLDAIKDGFVQGLTGPAASFFVDNPAVLDTKPYYDCLQRAFGTPEANAGTGCYDQKNFPNAPEWRMCMELSLQATSPNALSSDGSLATPLANCRKALPQP